MKKNFCLILLLLMLLTTSCDFINAPLRKQMIAYYSNDNNYAELFGKIEKTNVFNNHMLLTVSILTENHTFPSDAETETIEFIIVNFKDYGFELAIDDEILFVSANSYFYNGHVLPVIALKKSDKVLISFCDGKANYIDWIEQAFS